VQPDPVADENPHQQRTISCVVGNRIITIRRRCKFIPTNCLPAYARFTGASSNQWRAHPEHEPGVTRSGAPPLHRSR
jgi:hypothetical protein